ncbi:MAG: C/D box methylation guide ribonucleoprotein complex aNOP56 subunit [Candidatus Geothermarchaeota archaeon]
MRVYLTPVGIILQKDGEIYVHKFGETIDQMSKSLYDFYKGKYDLNEVVNKLKDEKEVEVASDELCRFLSSYKELEGKLRLVKTDTSLYKLLVKCNIAKDEDDAIGLTKEVIRKFTELKLKDELASKDLLIINAINAYDELTKVINLFYERLIEWYGIYFPELSEHVTSIDGYVSMVVNICRRENYTKKELMKLGYDAKKSESIESAALTSKGATLEDADIQIIRKFAILLKNLTSERSKLEEYISSLVEEVAPNLTAIVGPKLAARLIAKAGGLEKLATMPASTVQLLGAEKALFLSLRKGVKPPKHGIIFQHPFINQSPKVIRGKIARLMGSKLAIAARVDAFGGEFIGDKLYEEIKQKVESLRKQVSLIKKRRASKGKS